MKAALLALLLLAPSTSAGPAQLVYSNGGHGRVVALTFDAGADRGYAASILTTLERGRLQASFGMTGLWARQNPDLVRRMAKDHDILIDHTYDHRSFTGLSTHAAPLTAAQRSWEIAQADRIVRSLTHRTMRPYFRPPFGDFDRSTLTLARLLGYTHVVMWSVDSLGWERLPAVAILQRCLTLVRPGGIILMHVGSQSQDALALPSLINVLRQRGYRLVTIPQLLAGV